MYVPPHFAETDTGKLFDFIEANSFGLLVSQADGRPFASHLPLLLDRHAGPRGGLRGHVARANPQWRTAAGQEVLAVFSGPHAYISPTWYEAERVVPTWNYVAVHVYGTIHLIEDRDALLALVRDMVHYYERALPRPWDLGPANDYVNKMLQGIVGFRVEITRVEGKWKLGQNHPEERREKAARALEQCEDENSRAVAELMRQTLRQHG
jgi:transcriptional regulator